MTNISKFEYLKKEFKKIDNLFRLNKFLSVIEKSKKILKKYPEQTPFYNLIGISYKVSLKARVVLGGIHIRNTLIRT